MTVDVDELRARIARMSAASQPAVVETSDLEPERLPAARPPRREGLSSWHGSAELISQHDHFGFMVRDGDEQRCDPDVGGCGQTWVLLNDGSRPPVLYARPYYGTFPAVPRVKRRAAS